MILKLKTWRSNKTTIFEQIFKEGLTRGFQIIRYLLKDWKLMEILLPGFSVTKFIQCNRTAL